MRPELYRREGLHEQLDDQMTKWVMDDARGVRFDGDKALFNPIFDWYARDFSFFSVGEDLCTIAAQFATGDKKKTLERLAGMGCPHEFYPFDWALNEAR
jgi:hypothetical protein